MVIDIMVFLYLDLSLIVPHIGCEAKAINGPIASKRPIWVESKFKSLRYTGRKTIITATLIYIAKYISMKINGYLVLLVIFLLTNIEPLSVN